MVKIFETEADLDNEQAVAAVLEKAWNAEFKKLDRRYHVDFMICREGNGVAWAEVKCRTHASTDWPTIILELDKCMKLSQLAHETGLPSILIVKWTDRIGWINMHRPFPVRYTGKNDRYGMDGSPCTILAISDFTFKDGDGNEFRCS